MNEPLRITVEASVLQGWLATLRQISEPVVAYSGDRSMMQDRVIEQSARLARSLSEEIQVYLDPHDPKQPEPSEKGKKP